jgi:hypothetical protein
MRRPRAREIPTKSSDRHAAAAAHDGLLVSRRNLKLHQRHRSQGGRISLAFIGTSQDRFGERSNMA